MRVGDGAPTSRNTKHKVFHKGKGEYFYFSFPRGSFWFRFFQKAESFLPSFFSKKRKGFAKA